jgi:ankyrin repeat protein
LALASGAELLPDEHGRTPLHLAAANDDKAMITLLLKRCKDPLRAKAGAILRTTSRPTPDRQ